MKDLFFRISAKDATAAAFSAVRKSLSGVERGARNVQARVNDAGTSLQKLGLGIAAVTAGMGAMLTGSLNQYDQMAVAQARLDRALKTTGGAAGFTRGELESMAGELENLTRYSKADILSGVSAQFVSLKGISGDVFTRAQGLVLDVATAMGTDLAGAAKSVGEALSNPVNGLGALGEAGVRFTDTQTEMIKKMVEAGKTAEAQEVILDALAYSMGGQAAAAAEVGIGALKGFSTAWRDIQTDIGRAATGILAPFAQAARWIADAFLAIPEPLRNAAVAAGMGVTVFGALAVAVGAAALAFGALTAPILLIGGAVAAVSAAVALLAYYWDDVLDAGRVAWLGLKAVVYDAAQGMLDRIVGFANTAVNTFEGAVAGIQAFWSELPDGIGGYVIMAANAVIGGIEKMLNAARDRINTFLSGINAGAEFFGLSAPITLIPEVKMGRIEGDETGAAVAAAWDEAFTENRFEVPDLGADAVADQFREAFAGLGNSVSEAVDPVKDLTDAAGGLAAGLPDLTDGLDATGGAARGAGKDLDALTKKAKETEKEVKGAFDGLGSDVSQSLSDMVKNGGDGFSSMSESVLSVMTNMRDRLLSAVFDPIGDAIEEMLSNLIKGGMGGAGGGGGGGFGGLFSGIMGSLPGFDTGTDFVASGKSGIDRNVAAFRVSAGERVRVSRAGEGGGGNPITFNISTPDVAGFQKSKAQISAQLARAVGRAQRA